MPLRQKETPGAQHASAVRDMILPRAQHVSAVGRGSTSEAVGLAACVPTYIPFYIYKRTGT